MKKRLILLAGLGVGYVLGSRTGRQSYEKLKAQVQDMWSDPRVQETFERANQTIRDKAPGVADAVQTAADKVSAAAGAGAAGAGAGGAASSSEATASDSTASVSEFDGDEDREDSGTHAVAPSTATAKQLHDPAKTRDVFGDPERNLDDEGPSGVAEDD